MSALEWSKEMGTLIGTHASCCWNGWAFSSGLSRFNLGQEAKERSPNTRGNICLLRWLQYSNTVSLSNEAVGWTLSGVEHSLLLSLNGLVHYVSTCENWGPWLHNKLKHNGSSFQFMLGILMQSLSTWCVQKHNQENKEPKSNKQIKVLCSSRLGLAREKECTSKLHC